MDPQSSEVAVGAVVGDPPNASWLATHYCRLPQSILRHFLHCREALCDEWRNRPRDTTAVYILARRNLFTILIVLFSGIFTWEISVEDLRLRGGQSIVFPIYVPHAVSLSLASIWRYHILLGNFTGLYLARMYMAWRGSGLTGANTSTLLLVNFLAALQSHFAAFYLRKRLCHDRNKKFPTIDSVSDAVWFLVIVTSISLFFCTVISVCITATPLVLWSQFGVLWATWWLGVLTAMITVTPLIIHLMAWKCQPSLRRPIQLLEVLLTAAATIGVTTMIFFLDMKKFRPLPFLAYPFVAYAAFRFNRVGWAFTVSIISFFCSSGSIRKLGAMYIVIGRPPPWSTTLILQIELYSIVMGVVSITVAAAVREKKRLTRTLNQMNVDLEYQVDRRTLELRKANEELQISQKKAEMANHAKSHFLANMSHEIRTPIHGILGLTALLLESELTVDQKESLASSKECADLLLHIINSVLDLAKIESGRLEVERVPFNIRNMVSSTFRMLQARAQERGLKLLWEVDRGVPSSLVGDAGKIQQCLLNLVGNSLKFTHGGFISVTIGVASDSVKSSVIGLPAELSSGASLGVGGKLCCNEYLIAQAHESMLIHFEVRDTGIGINKEKLKDMFKPFTQADASTSRLYGGTGLGLCIVHRFVELLGGSIWVESEVGKGSAFHFCVPLFLNTSLDETSPEVSSEIISSGRSDEPWRLLRSLVSYPPSRECTSPGGGQPNSGTQIPPSEHALMLSSRHESMDDPVGRWKREDSTKLSFGGYSSFRDPVPKTREELIARSSDWRSRAYESIFTLGQSLLTNAVESDPPSQPRRSSWSYSETRKEFQASSVAFVNYEVSRERLIQVLHPRRSWDGGRGAFSQLKTDSLELVPWHGNSFGTSARQADSFQVVGTHRVASSIGSPPRREASLDLAFDCSHTEPTPTGLKQIPMPKLRRESSTELEKMLEGKLELRIILAGDNKINQKVASWQLEKHGHTVTIVGDGQHALETICERHDDFDLVLMDVQMPIMDGLSATKQIRKVEAEMGWSRVPIIGLTAHAIQGYQDTCLTHGMDGYLGKPFDIEQLLKTIGHILPR